MIKIKKGDTVAIMAGKDRGKQGKVLAVLSAAGRVIVEKVNVVTRHVKPTQTTQKGERVQKEAPIDLSNVMLVCPETKKPTRVGFQVKADGTKVRISKKSGKEIA